MVEAGKFAFYKDKPVAVESIDGSMAVIRWIERTRDRKARVTVPLADLVKFTKAAAKDVRKKCNQLIGQCNVRIHAIDECLNYYNGP